MLQKESRDQSVGKDALPDDSDLEEKSSDENDVELEEYSDDEHGSEPEAESDDESVPITEDHQSDGCLSASAPIADTCSTTGLRTFRQAMSDFPTTVIT